MEDVHRIIARKKAVWIGHIERGSDANFRNDFWRWKEASSNLWWQQTEQDLSKYGTSAHDIAKIAHQPMEIRKVFDKVGPTFRPVTI